MAPERVIIGDDSSAVAKQAGELAARIGGLFGARGVIVHAYFEMPEIDAKVRALDPRAADDAYGGHKGFYRGGRTS